MISDGIPTLARLPSTEKSDFVTPSKRINDGQDLAFWLTSTAYRDLTLWLLQLNRSMFPSCDANGENVKSCKLDSPRTYSPHVESVRSILTSYDALIAKAPPHTGPRRFGNVAFRDWYRLAEEATDELLESHFKDVCGDQTSSALVELHAYLLGSLGSAQRLDYGTGHELSFLAFLGCLWKLGVFDAGEEQAIVVGAIQPYLELIRKVILTYTLEPAGSHGVWGLDDHSFVPYILGSAQLGPPFEASDRTRPIPTEGSLKSAPSPSSVTNAKTVGDYKDSNMYFSAIQFIYEVKHGPFWEHSRVLYDISGIQDGWGKINKGMLKMYAAEVLGKFPVVQHFSFGHLFRWESDPESPQTRASIHAGQAMLSKDVPPPVAVAPPHTTGQMSASAQRLPGGGMPSTRAPWANTTASTGTGAGTAIPRAAAAHSSSPHTVAPWQARRGG